MIPNDPFGMVIIGNNGVAVPPQTSLANGNGGGGGCGQMTVGEQDCHYDFITKGEDGEERVGKELYWKGA